MTDPAANLETQIQAAFEQLHRRLTNPPLGTQIAVAESCTGGWLAQELTRRPGSSSYFWGGVVSYANEAKARLLGVPPRVMADHGAVSSETVAAMLSGLAALVGDGLCVAVSGVAGPGGGTPAKPVGLVVLGFGVAESGALVNSLVETHQFGGDRAAVQGQAVLEAGKWLFKQITSDIS